MYKVIILLCLFSGNLLAQTDDTTYVAVVPDIFEELGIVNESGGRVSIKGNAPVDDLIRLHIEQNRHQKSITGYRIQIFSGSSYDYSVDRLQQMKVDFEKNFPDIPVYLNYFDPDFKIRAGNFRSRLDCIPALKRIRYKYPSSYPVKTNIPISDLKKAAQPAVQDTVDNSVDENTMF